MWLVGWVCLFSFVDDVDVAAVASASLVADPMGVSLLVSATRRNTKSAHQNNM